MSCLVHRDEKGTLRFVGESMENKDSLYERIYELTNKILKSSDINAILAADPFLVSLYEKGLLFEKSPEEIALGLWAKAHQKLINTVTKPKKVALVWRQAGNKVASTAEGDLPLGVINFNAGESPASAVERAAEEFGKPLKRVNKLIHSRIENGEITYYYDVTLEGEPEHTTSVDEHAIPPKAFYEDIYKEKEKADDVELRKGFFVSKKTADKIQKMRKQSQSLKLTDNEENYVDVDGNLYQRVTTFINNGVKEEILPGWKIPSTTIGTMVDNIVRVVLGDHSVTSLDYNDFATVNVAEDIVAQEEFNKFVAELVKFRDNHPELHFLTDDGSQLEKGKSRASGIKLFSSKIKPSGENKEDAVGVAGETDIIAVDRNGNFRIIDSKTLIEESSGLKDRAKKWTKQLKTYNNLLAYQYGEKAEYLQILLSRPSYEYNENIKENQVKAKSLRFQSLITLDRKTNSIRDEFFNDAIFYEDDLDFYEHYDEDFEYTIPDAELLDLIDDDLIYDPNAAFQQKQRFRKLSKSMDVSINFYRSKISEINTQLKSKEVLSNPERYKRMTAMLAEYQNLLDQALVSSSELSDTSDFSTFETFAHSELDRLADRINKIISKVKEGDKTGRRFLSEINHSIRFWQSLGRLDNISSHPILDESEFNNERLLDIMTNIGSKADKLARLIANERLSFLGDIMKDTLNEDITEEKILEALTATKDVGAWQKMGFDISTFDDELLSSIMIVTKRANTRALNSIESNIRTFDSLIEKAGPKLNWDDFMQKYEDGSNTNRLVFRFTPEYQDAKNAARNIYYRNSVSEESSLKNNAYDEYMSWLRENEDVFNVIMLIPTSEGDSYHWSGSHLVDYTQENIDAHRQTLIDNLGEQDFNLYMNKLKENIDIFKQRYSLKKEELESTLPPAEAKQKLNIWEKENSPYWLAWKLSGTSNRDILSDAGVKINNGAYDILPSVPKRFKDGKPTGFYDTRYEKLKKDQNLSELYDFMLSVTTTLYNMVPQKAKSIGENGLPFIAKDIVEEFSSSSILGFPKEMYDKAIKYLTQKDYGTVDYQQRDSLSGKPIKRVTFTADTGREKINSAVKIKMVEWETANRELLNGKNEQERQRLLGEKRAEFRKQARIDLASESSSDVRKVLNAYIMAATMYHHKAAVEDIVNMAVDTANERAAYITTTTGDVMTEADGTTKKTSGTAKNKIEALDHFQDSFYQNSFQNKQYVSKNKKYTSKEKDTKTKLEELLAKTEEDFQNNLIPEDVYNNQRKILERELESLGGNIAGSRVGDAILKWIQLKGLGWNFKSAVGNFAFGYMSNSVEASRNRLFSEKDLANARSMLRHSVIKSWSFGAIDKGEAKKIKSIMERLDVLKDASSELEKASRRSKLNKRLAPLKPYHLTKTTEYVNQAQTMVAFLLNEKNMLEDVNGNKVSLYEAFDEEGRFDHERFGDKYNKDFVADVKAKIDQVIKLVHGNYDEMSPILAKKFIEGRALIQFKTWFLESWRSRWGAEQKDHILGIKLKGRYQSAIDAFIKDEGNRGQNILDSIKNILRKYLNITSFGIIKGEFTGMENLSEVDRQNMQANIAEFIMWANCIGLFLILKYGFKDDDEDNDYMAVNILLNQISRLSSDIELYGSPFQLANFAQNMIPATSLIKDMSDIVTSVSKTMNGDYYIQSGAYEGIWRIPKEVGEALPISYGGMSVYKTLYNTQEDETLFGKIFE